MGSAALRIFDRAGLPITLAEWEALRQTDYRVLCQESIGDAWVSTVWLGIDHATGDPPLIFETMIFGGEHNETVWRTSTESVAWHVHMLIVIYLRISTKELPR